MGRAPGRSPAGATRAPSARSRLRAYGEPGWAVVSGALLLAGDRKRLLEVAAGAVDERLQQHPQRQHRRDPAGRGHATGAALDPALDRVEGTRQRHRFDGGAARAGACSTARVCVPRLTMSVSMKPK